MRICLYQLKKTTRTYEKPEYKKNMEDSQKKNGRIGMRVILPWILMFYSFKFWNVNVYIFEKYLKH